MGLLHFNNVALAQKDSIYKDSNASIEERVNDLISKMTLEEKIGQMTQLDISLINSSGSQKDVDIDLKKASKFLSDHHIGSFLNGEAVDQKTWYEYIYNLQKIAIDDTRLGIPIIYGIDHMHGASYLKNATIFPHNLNLAASFDPKHAYNSSDVTVLESGDLGHNWVFAPVLDLGKNPKWPRLYETYGESPYLASIFGKEAVRGIQEKKDNNNYQVAATAKHFLGYSDPKSGWDRTPVDLSDQSIYEFHLPAFKAAINEGLSSVMINSGEVNGIPVHASKRLLKDLLRDELGFDGVIVTDWDDIGKLVDFHFTAENYTEATFQAIDAGIDISMTPLSLAFNESLLKLVNEGRISESRLDESVKRILTLKFKLGLFENPYPNNKRFDRLGRKDSKLKAQLAAEESIVLLKNSGDLLPLNSANKTVLVVGPSADSKRNLSGGWTISWQGGKEEQYSESVYTIKDALIEEFPNYKFLYAKDWKDSEEVKKLAQDADLIITAIGEEPYTEFVGNITDLSLPEDQINLINQLSKIKKPIISIFVGGRPRVISDILSNIDAFVWAGLPGNFGAKAISKILSGAVNPSGKLPFSYPNYPSHFAPYNHKPSDSYFFDSEEANQIKQNDESIWEWPFGHGLSYTDFKYSDISLNTDISTFEAKIVAEIKVTNTGKVTGKESVLWFIKDEVGSITRPIRELKNIHTVVLDPGESQTLTFVITPIQDLSFPNNEGNYLLEEGNFTLMVGNKKARFQIVESKVTGAKIR